MQYEEIYIVLEDLKIDKNQTLEIQLDLLNRDLLVKAKLQKYHKNLDVFKPFTESQNLNFRQEKVYK